MIRQGGEGRSSPSPVSSPCAATPGHGVHILVSKACGAAPSVLQMPSNAASVHPRLSLSALLGADPASPTRSVAREPRIGRGSMQLILPGCAGTPLEVCLEAAFYLSSVLDMCSSRTIVADGGSTHDVVH